MPAMRRNIYFSEPQGEYLIAEAKRLGIAVTELVRRIVDQHREQETATKMRKGHK